MKTKLLSAHMIRKKYKTLINFSSGKIDQSEFPLKVDFLDGHLDFKNDGILYLLYKNDTLYYIGKSSQQGCKRVLQHKKTRHAEEWNNIYILSVKKKYLTVLENLMISVACPPGNRKTPMIPTKGTI